MKFLAVILVFFSISAFGFEKCMILFDEIEFDHPIEVSPNTSFKGCPDSILTSDKWVLSLRKVEVDDNEKRFCFYANNSIMLRCE